MTVLYVIEATTLRWKEDVNLENRILFSNFQKQR